MNLEMETRGKSFSIVILIFFIIFLLWAVLQFISPYGIPEDSVKDLSGITGILDNQEIINEMQTPWTSIYGCGDNLCHQRADRSFFINGNQDSSDWQSYSYTPTGSNVDMEIAADCSGGRQFNGLIDELTIYSRALEPEEVVTLYQSQ